MSETTQAIERSCICVIRVSTLPPFLRFLCLILDVPSQETEQLCICVLEVSVMYLCVRGSGYVFVC